MTPFNALLHRIMQTPAADKLGQFAADWKKAEADELAADEAAYWHRRELIDAARAADREALDGEAA